MRETRLRAESEKCGGPNWKVQCYQLYDICSQQLQSKELWRMETQTIGRTVDEELLRMLLTKGTLQKFKT